MQRSCEQSLCTHLQFTGRLLWGCVLLVHVVLGSTACVRPILAWSSIGGAYLFRHRRGLFDLFFLFAGHLYPRILHLLLGLCDYHASVVYRGNFAF